MKQLQKSYKTYYDKSETYAENPQMIRRYIRSFLSDTFEIYNVKNILDYGAGRGTQYTEHYVHTDLNLNNLKYVKLYDPAIKEYSELNFINKDKNNRDPMFDAVVCTDVIEHVPGAEIHQTFSEIFSNARKLVVMTISCNLAKSMIPHPTIEGDFVNAHCTLYTPDKWLKIIKKTKPKNLPVYVFFAKFQEDKIWGSHSVYNKRSYNKWTLIT